VSSEPNEPAEAIRPLGLEALEACLELDGAALGGFWNRQQWHTELVEPRRPCLGLWLGQHLQALACGWLVVDELHITAVAVRPQQRRRGLGRRVLAALLLEGSAQGAAHATLEVAADNSAAQALYATAGFQTAGIRRAYYRNGQDALIQWLKLDQTKERS
jgi:ribosomal-protein-alanine N-acetyltransferase